MCVYLVSGESGTVSDPHRSPRDGHKQVEKRAWGLVGAGCPPHEEQTGSEGLEQEDPSQPGVLGCRRPRG